MAEDASGRIWIGTSEGQLLYSCEGLLVSEPETSQLRPMSIRCLYATADGSLWVGYAGAGVGRLKEGRFTRITTAQGLHDNYISQIVADQRGSLWFGANRGIFHVRQEELDAVCDGKSDRVRSVVYGRGEGLPNLQASFDFFPGALRSGDGRLWMPMRSGLALVHPDNIRDNPERPIVLIERSLVDGQVRAFQDSLAPLRDPTVTNAVDLRTASGVLRLKPVHRKIDFEFSALSFTAPENVHFRYKLERVDDNWIEAGTVRNASYSRLAAGNYQFRVIACNNVGVWNPKGAALSFVVLPFFWQTWWFRVGALGAFTLSLIAIVRYVSFRRLRLEMQHLKEQAALHKERARIAKDIHDDLGASLTQIALLSELAHQDRATPQRTGEHIEKISGTARNVIKSLDEIVWAVNPRNDTLAHFIDYTGQFALDYLRVAGIRCRLDFPEKTPEHELSTDVRHNLFLVAKEAIHNVVKHAKATEAWLRISAAESGLRMEIEDDGSGFAGESADRCADGLRNMRNRISEAGGHCHIESRPGKGTRVTVDLPWPKD